MIKVKIIKYKFKNFNFKFHESKIVIVIKKVDNKINNKLKLSNDKWQLKILSKLNRFISKLLNPK